MMSAVRGQTPDLRPVADGVFTNTARGDGRFLIKPFTPAQMLSAVRQCLDGVITESGPMKNQASRIVLLVPGQCLPVARFPAMTVVSNGAAADNRFQRCRIAGRE